MPPRYPIFVLTVAVLIGLCFGATPSAAQPPFNVIGQWSQPFQPFTQPYFPVHSHMLPTGKVMFWPGDGGVSGNDPRSWDPANPGQSASSLSKPGYDIFCSGHSFLADGRLFVAGGHNGSNNVGLSRASTYDPFATTNAWSNLSDMNDGRWYPTTTVLANGDILVVSGSIDLTVGNNPEPQVFQIATGTWRDLTNAHLVQSLYPWMLLAPNGRVFHAGWSATTRYLNTVGDGAWSAVDNRVDGVRDYGSAVMYEPGKVLVMGGGSPPKNTAEVIDLNEGSPSWRLVDSMEFSRRQINATLLPDGTVLVTGGTDAPGFSEPSGHKDAAELWDPATGNWTTLASSSGIPRVYHSTAFLLPDGRVLSTGGNDHPEIEIYSPPYLFKGAKPAITSAPTSIAYGQSFFVGTPNAAAISKIRILRLSSVTHAFNQSQYINELSFSQTPGGLNVTAPRAPTAIGSPSAPPVVAPPGHYLLFILNGTGVPSDARIIRLGGTAPSDTTLPTVSIDAPANNATVSGTVTVSATASDNVAVAGVQFRVDSANLGAEDISSPYSVPWNSTTATNGPHTLTAVARDAAGNTTTSAGRSVTVNNAGPSCTQTPLNVSAASSDGGFAYKVNGSFGTPADNSANTTRSVLKLFENSLEQGPAHSSHANIRNLGQGRFSHWSTTTGSGESLRFSASDNTDPRNNGRSYTYCVPGTGPDATPPTVSLTAPANSATVSGTAVTVDATAADNVGVAGVQFRVDSANLGAEDISSPYSVPWNSTTATNGPHTLTAVARDAAGNTTTSAGRSVTVNNAAPDPTPPTVSITAPASGATVSGTVTVSATASDNVAVAGVQFRVDSANLGAEDISSPYSVPWNSTTATNGPHTLTAVARDAAGNTTTSAGRSVTVNNAGPSCTQTPLNVSAASSDGGFAYKVNGSFGTPADNSANTTRSVLKLFENSLERGPAHSSHANIRNLGQGRFSHWSTTTGSGESLRFSASDNTDPRNNGRSYTYCVP